jgi:hypothetical protein
MGSWVFLELRLWDFAHRRPRFFCRRNEQREQRVVSYGSCRASIYGDMMPRNPAVTDLAAFIVTVQILPDAVSHPLHPVNTERGPGVAVSVTVVPLTYDSEQSLPQLMPAGLELTVPAPMSPDF